jgi:hypothetical protein
MKNKFTALQRLILFSLLLMTGCDRSPQVFSVNNFASVLEDCGSVATVAPLPVEEIEGTWIGMEHQIRLSAWSLNNINMYKAELTDTAISKSNNKDTTAYEVLFITIAGQPFVEVISEGTRNADHDFMIPLSTYFKINKLTADTIIVQMPKSDFTEAYLKANGYSYFVPYECKREEIYPVYVTEDPVRLASLLSGLSRQSKAFQAADTIVRKH